MGRIFREVPHDAKPPGGDRSRDRRSMYPKHYRFFCEKKAGGGRVKNRACDSLFHADCVSGIVFINAAVRAADGIFISGYAAAGIGTALSRRFHRDILFACHRYGKHLAGSRQAACPGDSQRDFPRAASHCAGRTAKIYGSSYLRSRSVDGSVWDLRYGVKPGRTVPQRILGAGIYEDVRAAGRVRVDYGVDVLDY